MKKQSKNLILFLSITFLMPLIAVFLQIVIKNPAIEFWVYGLEAASPSIAAIIVLLLSKETKVFFKKNIKLEKIITALVLSMIIAFIPIFLSKWITGLIAKDHFDFAYISASQFLIILWSFVAEELGWRGYLQMSLMKNIRQRWLMPLIIGTIWGLWHYHYFLFHDMQVPIILFFISCIVESYIYDYLLRVTKNNLFSAMMYHFSYNLFIHICAVNPEDNNGSILPYVILILLEVLILIIFRIVYKRNRCRGVVNA